MKRDSRFTFVIVAGVAAILSGTGLYAQAKGDKYALKSPSGIAFADFKGYEDWAVVSSAFQPPLLKAHRA